MSRPGSQAGSQVFLMLAFPERLHVSGQPRPAAPGAAVRVGSGMRAVLAAGWVADRLGR